MKHPDFLDLLTLWLETKHKFQPAVVFTMGLDFVQNIEPHFKRVGLPFDPVDFISAQYVILPCASLGEAGEIMNATPEGAPYTYVWDGKKITGHHS